MTEAAAEVRVGDAMLRHPTVHPVGLTVAEARAVFAARPKTHLLLLVDHGVLVSTLTRADLERAAGPADAPAAGVGSLAARTVSPDLLLASTRAKMIAQGLRRVAVVDPEMHLLGLLCLKARLTDFCTDEGVAAMRAERAERDRPEAREQRYDGVNPAEGEA